MESMDSIWPSSWLDGNTSSSASVSQTRTTVPIAPSRGEKRNQPLIGAAPPALGKTNFIPPKVTPGSATGTFVGQKVDMLRSELKRMRQQISIQNNKLQSIRRLAGAHSVAYHSAIASINSRLQVGTTPGNPYMVNQWNIAQTGLSKIDSDISSMNSLANEVAGTSTMSAYLLETTRAAYGLSGAVESDHRQLAILEDEVNRTVVLIDRLLNELSEDINRQTTYVAAERSNLTALSLAIKNGEALGSSLSNRAYAMPSSINNPPANVGSIGPSGRQPLIIIRFNKPNVRYQQALYSAVNRVLQRRPQAGFDLIAVASGKGSAGQVTVAGNKSKRNAEMVLRSLADMGLPLQRIRLSAITSKDATTNEVHLFVR
tara:strand:- start:945 stop:2063 length:1119 start_codon:yes stop_codon:yes gene_type:complete